MNNKLNYTSWKFVTLAVLGSMLISGAAFGQTPTPSATPVTVSLPIDTLDTTVPDSMVVPMPVNTTDIDSNLNYVGFQADFNFDETVLTFGSPPVMNAGLTGGNWNVSGNVIPGGGPMRTLRVSAFSNDFTPLSGSGMLYQIRMLRVSGTPGASTGLVWQPDPNNFIFIDANLDVHVPNQTDGMITITG